jgi:hypothetical protein
MNKGEITMKGNPCASLRRSWEKEQEKLSGFYDDLAGMVPEDPSYNRKKEQIEKQKQVVAEKDAQYWECTNNNME